MPSPNARKHRRRSTREAAPKDTERAQAAAWWTGTRGALLVGLVALAVRLLHLFDLARLPIFDRPTVDAALYVESARRVAESGWPTEVFFKPPLYPLALALWWRLVGETYVLLRLPLVFLGAGTAVLTWAVARRLFDARVALLAGLFYALHRSAVYFESELLEIGLVTFVHVAALFLSARAADAQASTRTRVAAGLALGVGCVARPTFLLFTAVALAWLGRRRMLPALAGVVLAIAPVTLHNAYHGRDFVLVSSNLGLNFHIGNNALANGRISATAELPAQPAAAERVARQIAERDAGRALLPSEVSRYWLRRGVDYLASHPARAVELGLRKLLYSWHGSEISDNEDLASLRHWLRLYPWLPIGMWLLAPLGLIGLVAARPPTRVQRLAQLFVAAQILGILPFFVVERFRLPWAPVLCIFAAWIVLRLVQQMRQRTVAWRLPLACAVAMLALNAPVLGVRDAVLFDLDYKIAYAYQQKGDTARAEHAYRRAIERNPRAALARNGLGYLLAERGEKLDEAVALIEEALRLDPQHTANYAESLALAHIKRADADAALQACELGLRAAVTAQVRAALLARQAEAHRMRGDARAETESLNEILRIAPQGAQAPAARERLSTLRARPQER